MIWKTYVPRALQTLYEIRDYHHAAAILASEFPDEFWEICEALRMFRFSEGDIVKKGGSESEIPRIFARMLRSQGWMEKKLQVKLTADEKEISHDTHKIDFIKGRVACDLEWNSKDQTFDRDLYAFRHFFEYDVISAAVLVTRSNDLDPLFKSLGIMKKYGASTTHIGKLLPRLSAGRNGGCPVLVFGITRKLLKETR